MAIGRTFKEAFGKAWRGLEKTGADLGATYVAPPDGAVLDSLRDGTEGRFHLIERAFAEGHGVDEIAAASSIDPWFVDQMAQVFERVEGLAETQPRTRTLATLGPERLREAKRVGLSDARIARATGSTERRGAGPSRGARCRPRVQVGGHLWWGVPGPDAVPLLHLRGGVGGRARVPPARRDPRRRTQPDRTGHRVRLRLRARRVRPGRGGVRVGDDQLEPGDRLHRLRHVEPAVLRAA